MNERLLLAVAVTAVVAPAAPGQERVVTDDAPLPPRAEDTPHPDGVVSAEQLTELRPESKTRRNIELALGLLFVVALLVYAFFRKPRTP